MSVNSQLAQFTRQNKINQTLRRQRIHRCSNPEVRANIKSALSSTTCPPTVKAKIFENFSHVIGQRSVDGPKIYRQELEKISNEIVGEGGEINLWGVILMDVTITLNLRNADLTGAHISMAEIFSDCTGVNLTNVRFEEVGFGMQNCVARHPPA